MYEWGTQGDVQGFVLLTFDHQYIYDGWNLIAETDALAPQPFLVEPVVRLFTWGLDLAGQNGAAAVGAAGGLPRGAGGIGRLLALTDVQYSSVIEGGLMAVAGPATGGQSVALLAQSGASQAGGAGVTVPLADESGNGGRVLLDDVLAPGGGSELTYLPAATQPSESGRSTSQSSPVTMELVAVHPTGEQSLQLTFADGGGNVALGDFEIGEPQHEFYSYWYAYDANGNVGQVVDGWTGDTVAAYEYDAYGRTIAACGPKWIDNPFRFSTKFAEDDAASELVETPPGSGYYVDADPMYYYGYRYYLPRMGRWGSRDPIGVFGGANLYTGIANRPTQSVDPFGLYGPETHERATRHLAEVLGCSAREAALIGQADQGQDWPENAAPLNGVISMVTLGLANLYPDHQDQYDVHFPGAGAVIPVIPQEPVIEGYDHNLSVKKRARAAFDSCSLWDLGKALHSVQDSYSHGGQRGLWAMGGHPSGRRRYGIWSDDVWNRDSVYGFGREAPSDPAIIFSGGLLDTRTDDPNADPLRWEDAMKDSARVIRLFEHHCRKKCRCQGPAKPNEIRAAMTWSEWRWPRSKMEKLNPYVWEEP
ncbi:MAG: RHS repeat-associated core domain-containing protein [Phycisphaerae bacterium]